MGFTAEDLDKIIQQRNNISQDPGFIRSRSLSVLRYTRHDPMTLVLGGLFLVGVLIGTLLVGRSSADTQSALQTILGGYLERRQLQAFSTIAFSAFLSLSSSLLILFFCGFCSIAQPVILGVPLFKGLGYGFSVGMLYVEYGIKVIPLVGILILPPMLLGTMLLITAGRTSLRLSINLFRTTISESEQGSRVRIKRYLIKFGFFLGVCLLIALLDAILFSRFGSLLIPAV